MITNYDEQKVENAQRAYEQAKARFEKAKKKQNEKNRKRETHYKCMMGGIVKKYFPSCMEYEEQELNEILSVALATDDCKAVIERIRQEAERTESVRAKTNAQAKKAIRAHVKGSTSEADSPGDYFTDPYSNSFEEREDGEVM